MLLQYYADDTPQDDPEEFDANRAALGLRTRLRKVHVIFVTYHMSSTAALHQEQNMCLVPLS